MLNGNTQKEDTQMNERYDPTPAALYARVSSDRQDVDLSVAAQLRALSDYARKNGYLVAREYVDEAGGGRIDRALRHYIRAVVEWMRQRRGRLHPVQAVVGSGNVVKKGESTVSGWTAEHTSWRNPGSVRAADRAPPPTVSLPSTTSTVRPLCAMAIPADRPFGPAPTTSAS